LSPSWKRNCTFNALFTPASCIPLNTHTHTHTRTRTRTRAHTHTHTHSLSLSLSHTHTHTARMHAHGHRHRCQKETPKRTQTQAQTQTNTHTHTVMQSIIAMISHRSVHNIWGEKSLNSTHAPGRIFGSFLQHAGVKGQSPWIFSAVSWKRPLREDVPAAVGRSKCGQ